MAGNQALPLSSSILQNTVNTRNTGKATRNRLGGSGGQDTRKAGASDGETDIRNKTLTRSGGEKCLQADGRLYMGADSTERHSV